MDGAILICHQKFLRGIKRIVGPGKTRGYPYPVCKKRIVSPGKTRGYPYPVCKKRIVIPGPSCSKHR